MDESTNIYEYEELLSGQRKSFAVSFRGNKQQNEKEAGNIWRYAVTHLLKWTPQEAVVNLTKPIATQLLLDKTLDGIGLDPNVDYIPDYRIVLQHAFPNEVKYDFAVQSIEEYEHYAKLGKYKNDSSYVKLPKKFFIDTQGISRSHILLRYLIDTYLSDFNVFELYSFFGNTDKAKAWLKSKKLDAVFKYVYTSPLEYLHDSLPIDKSDDLLYHAFLVKNKV